MKKFKLLGLLAMMLVVATVLVSCGTVSNLKKVYNEDYDTNEKLFNQKEEITSLEDFTLIADNNEFAVFSKLNETDGSVETKVYSFRKMDVVKAVTSNDTVEYTISLVYGAPVFCAVKEEASEVVGEEDTVTLTYYDANGDEVVVVDEDKEIGTPNVVSNKMIIINAVIYNIDVVTGALTKKGDLPAYVSYDDVDYCNDEYFYVVNDDDYMDTSIVIYDLDFNPVTVWSAPSYATEIAIVRDDLMVMNNGNVLVQYKVALDEDAKDFDFYEGTVKYDLVSLVLTTKGDVKEIDVDYIVAYIETNYELYDDTKAPNENYYTDKFENIAAIYRIENQQIDESYLNMDIVLMNNSGKAQKSLKVVDGQYGEAYKVADDLYAASTVYGFALLNGKGDVQYAVTAADAIQRIVGGYIVTDRAIYTTSFELVYDLVANDAELYKELNWVALAEYLAEVGLTMDQLSENELNQFYVNGVVGNSVFVKAGDEEKYEIIRFCGGEQETVYSYNEENDSNKEFELFSNIGYAIIDTEAESYKYYAADGTELLSVSAAAKVVASNEDDVVIVKVDKTYYVLTKTVAEDAE